MAKQRGYEIVHEYTDTISGAKSTRPGLDTLLADARRRRFDVVLVAAFDRAARSVRHFLEVLDELNHLGIEFVSFRENIDTGGPLGRAVVVIVGAIAELERSLIVERVRAGMRRAKLEGRQIGRAPLAVDRQQIVRDRLSGLSLTEVARQHRIPVRREACKSDAIAQLPINGVIGDPRGNPTHRALVRWPTLRDELFPSGRQDVRLCQARPPPG